jgi:hypothetical protein
MRAALSERAAALYTFQTFPAITGCGALVMAEPGALPGTGPGSGPGTGPGTGTDGATPMEASS